MLAALADLAMLAILAMFSNDVKGAKSATKKSTPLVKIANSIF